MENRGNVYIFFLKKVYVSDTGGRVKANLCVKSIYIAAISKDSEENKQKVQERIVSKRRGKAPEKWENKRREEAEEGVLYQ